MNRFLIDKYIRGDASGDEQRVVEEWAAKSENNMAYLASLKNIWVFNHLPEGVASQEEWRGMKGRIIKKKKIFFLRYVAVAACIIMLLSLTLNIYQYADRKVEQTALQYLKVIPGSINRDIPVKTQVLYTNKGVKGLVILPDSSKVWLNSDTKISYPEKFGGGTRNVQLSGEAYFEVKTNPDTPMVVTTNNGVKVEVLGTKFLIKSYEEDLITKTTLFSGSINLYTKNNGNGAGRVTKMRPLETVIIDSKRALTLIPKSDTTKLAAWKAGKLFFDDIPLNVVFKELERWHGVEFTVKDTSIYKYNLTAKFKSESLIQILEIMKYCAPIDYLVKDDKVIISKR